LSLLLISGGCGVAPSPEGDLRYDPVEMTVENGHSTSEYARMSGLQLMYQYIPSSSTGTYSKSSAGWWQQTGGVPLLPVFDDDRRAARDTTNLRIIIYIVYMASAK